MSTNVTLHAGHDVAYFTSGQGRGGCAGAMSYYTAAGEPPGEWAGKGAAGLGLSGVVDPGVIARLYQHNIGPGGDLLVKPRHTKAAAKREQAAVTAYLAAQPKRRGARPSPLPGRLARRGVIGHGPGAAAVALAGGEVGHVVARVQRHISGHDPRLPEPVSRSSFVMPVSERFRP